MGYFNLKAELKRHGITYEEASAYLGMSRNNFSLKMNERVPFTIDEMKAIRDRFFRDANLDYLTESDGDKPSEKEKRLSRLDALENFLDEIDAEPELYESLSSIRSEVESGRGDTFFVDIPSSNRSMDKG